MFKKIRKIAEKHHTNSRFSNQCNVPKVFPGHLGTTTSASKIEMWVTKVEEDFSLKFLTSFVNIYSFETQSTPNVANVKSRNYD